MKSEDKPFRNALLLFLLALIILALVLIPTASLQPIMPLGAGITIAMILLILAIVWAIRPDLIQRIKKIEFQKH